MQSDDKSIELFQEIVQTHNAIGYDALKQVIVGARPFTSNKKDKADSHREKVGKFIIKEICRKFSIAESELLHGKSHGTRTQALMVGFVVCQKVLGAKQRGIAKIFFKDRRNIGREIYKYNKMNPDSKYEKPIIDKCEALVITCLEFYENLKTENK